MKHSILILAILLLSFSSYSQPQSYKGIDGNSIRGLNCYNNVTEKDIDSVKEWGGNTLRAMLMIHDLFNLSGYDTCSEKIDSDKLDKLQEIVDLCRDKNIMVIIDVHEIPGLVRWSGWKDFRLWEQNRTGEKCRKLLIQAWQKIAETFVDYPDNAVAYELLNEAEPKGNDWNAREVRSNGNIWNNLQQKIVSEIRKIDTVHTIICSPPFSWRISSLSAKNWTPPPALLADGKIMLAVHMYHPLDFTLQWTAWNNAGKALAYPGYFSDTGAQKIMWNKQQLRSAMDPVAQFKKKYPDIPIVITEFSVMRILPGAAQYLSDLIDIFKELGVGWTYHVYKEADYLNSFNDCSDTMFELKDIPKGGRKALTSDPADRFRAVVKGFKNK